MFRWKKYVFQLKIVRKVTISSDIGSEVNKKHYLLSSLSRALQPFANAVARRRTTNGEAIAFVDACWFCATVARSF